MPFVEFNKFKNSYLRIPMMIPRIENHHDNSNVWNFAKMMNLQLCINETKPF